MHPLQVVANCLQEAISRPQSILLCFLAFTLFACEPQDSLSLTYTEHQGLQNFALHKIFFTDDKHGYAMGGDEYQYGVVQTTMDGGLTWSLDTISQKSVYDFDVHEDLVCSAGVRGYITYKEEGAPWREIRPAEPMNANSF